MPHNHLQDALAYLHTLYATYEAQGITITGSRMPLTQYANFAAMKYLLFLANQDRVITDAETNFINNCLQQSATTQTMERFLQQFSISFFRCGRFFTGTAGGIGACRFAGQRRRGQHFPALAGNHCTNGNAVFAEYCRKSRATAADRAELHDAAAFPLSRCRHAWLSSSGTGKGCCHSGEFQCRKAADSG